MKNYWCDELNERVNRKLARMLYGERRINALRHRFKAANQRVDKTIARYRNALSDIWIVTASGERIHAIPCAFQYNRTYGWQFREYLTEAYDVLYEMSRHKKKRVDVDAVKKLESKVEAAFAERERLIEELESVGEDVWKDAKLWQ